MVDPGLSVSHGGSSGDLDHDWVRRVGDTVAEELASADRDGRWDEADKRSWSRKLIADELDALAAERLDAGSAQLTQAAEERWGQAVLDRLFGLGRLQRWLDDPLVTDVMVNGCDQVWVDLSDGTRMPVEPVADSDDELVRIIRQTAARVGRSERRWDAGSPTLDLRLPDGSRLHAVMIVSGRPSVSIRRHRFDLASLDDLQAQGTVDQPLSRFLSAAVRARRNILVAGGTGAGKTTLLRALIRAVPDRERLITVEDSLELAVERWHRNVVALEARHANLEGQGAVGLDVLVREGLRMNPDRVVVGEIRDGSALLSMLQAMTQGQDGSMGTIHASSARQVVNRLITYGLTSPQQLTPEATAHLAAGAIDLIVYIGGQRHREGQGRHRRVEAVAEVTLVDGSVATNTLFEASLGSSVPAQPVPGFPVSNDLQAALAAVGWHRGSLL